MRDELERVTAERDAAVKAFGEAWATAERYRLALDSMRHEAEAARAHRMRQPGIVQVGTPRWGLAPLSTLLDIIRTVDHAEVSR